MASRCTLTATWWLDLDAAEVANPGVFINQPLTVTLERRRGLRRAPIRWQGDHERPHAEEVAGQFRGEPLGDLFSGPSVVQMRGGEVSS